MTEETEIVADEPQEEIVADEPIESNEEDQANNDSENEPENNSDSDDVEFPKKAVNALNRKTKTINKLRARLQELEAKQQELNNSTEETKPVNADDFETMEEYLNAKMNALVNEQLQQSNKEQQSLQLTQEQQALLAERNQHIAQQAQEVAQAIPDFQQVIGQHTQELDSMPDTISEIFYSIDSPTVAAYVLAKEGKLESLRYSNPHVAANLIISAEQRGVQLLNKPQKSSSVPEPMKGSKGQVKTTKNLMEGSVLKNLGLKS